MSSAENYPVILSKLQEEGIKFKPDNGSELLPTTPIEVCEYSISKFYSSYLTALV